MDFGAHFAGDDPELYNVEDMPGVDGFKLKVDPLYKVIVTKLMGVCPPEKKIYIAIA